MSHFNLWYTTATTKNHHHNHHHHNNKDNNKGQSNLQTGGSEPQIFPSPGPV